jgi:hypothetical protein
MLLGNVIIGLVEEPCYANNHELLKKNVTSVYLRASIDTRSDCLIKAKTYLPAKVMMK